jgi:glyoxylase I family protein
MEAIDHLDLVVDDLERSLAFYTGLLEPLGYSRRTEIAGERGERVIYIGRPGGYGSVSLRERQSRERARPYDRYDLGIHHICFSADSRERVDERAGWARENGAAIESGPREYDYTPGYYAVFFHDPDGIKLEIVHRPRPDSGQ